MSKGIREPTTLFRPFLVAGIILVAFVLSLRLVFSVFWIGNSVILLQEEGQGFKIIGTRFRSKSPAIRILVQ
ncbi:MAG: hypothetical protein WA421_02825 [Nitrososphaeraceae archaeon]